MNPIEYLRTHIPRCISELNSSILNFPKKGSDITELCVNPIHELSCKCGCSTHSVHGFEWINKDYGNQVVFLGPIELECTQCAKRTIVFDSGEHGYDPELGHGCYSVSGEGEKKCVQCSSCHSSVLEVTVRFEYTEDLFTEEFAQYADRLQDLFTWFWIDGRCVRCGNSWELANFECA